MPARRWQFTLSDEPVTDRERHVLTSDLRLLGADDGLLDVWAATVATRSRRTHPLILRGRRDGAFAGLAVVLVCRSTGRSFATGGVARALDAPGLPVWYWERTSLGTDGHAGPGVVAPGVVREEWVDAALAWLSRRFVLGALIEPTDDEPPDGVRGVPGVVTDFPPTCVLDLRADGSAAALRDAHAHLRRKERKFANKGGSVERLSGPLPVSWQAPLVTGYAQVRALDPPFAEHYPAMVRATWALPATEHLVARLGGRVVGYHSFAVTGVTMALLSGVFDTSAGSTFHAYENVLLAAAEVAADRGCDLVQLGPAMNPVKSSLASTSPARLRFVTRWPPVRAALRLALPHTRLAPTRVRAAQVR